MRPCAQHLEADPDDDPAQRLEFGDPVDVAAALPRVGPVLGPVEFHRHLVTGPPHIEPGDKRMVVVDRDLSTRGGQPALDQKQARPCFLRGLGAGIRECDGLPQVPDSSRAGVAGNDAVDLFHADTGGVS